jgi:hypothetical protein
MSIYRTSNFSCLRVEQTVGLGFQRLESDSLHWAHQEPIIFLLLWGTDHSMGRFFGRMDCTPGGVLGFLNSFRMMRQERERISSLDYFNSCFVIDQQNNFDTVVGNKNITTVILRFTNTNSELIEGNTFWNFYHVDVRETFSLTFE